LKKAFVDSGVLAQSSPMSNSGSEEDFVKISPQDILEEESKDIPDVFLPTMGTNFRVN